MMRWTDAEIALLCAMYPHCHTEDVALWIGRSLRKVYQAANARGLRKDSEYLASDAACRIKRGHENEAMKASRFKPGLIPWNKGIKGSTGVQEACRRTQFKLGSRPQTWVPVGSYRVCYGVLQRKVNDNPGPSKVRWYPVHRMVWEEAYGPVPAGHIVRFKRGYHTTVLEQITADRLECITRAENARTNHPRSRSPELGRLIQLKGAIARQVNRIAREAQEQRT